MRDGLGSFLALLDRIADGVDVGVTVLDVLCVPAVRLVALATTSSVKEMSV